MTTAARRQKRADHFVLAAWIGTFGVVAVFCFHALFTPAYEQSMVTAGIIFLASLLGLVAIIYSFIYMVLRRKTDEFTLAMWHSGTSVAFAVAVAWLLFGNMIEISLAEPPMMDAPTTDAEAHFVERIGVYVIIAAFFVGFHFKRLRG